MSLQLQACIQGRETDPSGLSNGHLLQFCSTLSGLADLANHSPDFESKLDCIASSLRAQYGEANVVQLIASPNPMLYIWVWEDGHWVRKCMVDSTLEISQMLGDGSTLVILLELKGSVPYEP